MDEMEEEEMKQIERIMLLEREQRKLEDRAKALERERDELYEKVCDKCDGTGWIENRVEGKAVCGCMEELEPYYLLQKENATLRAEVERLKNLLENVINELDLSEAAMETHGPLGTEPSVLVKFILAEKDQKIKILKSGMKEPSND